MSMLSNIGPTALTRKAVSALSNPVPKQAVFQRGLQAFMPKQDAFWAYTEVRRPDLMRFSPTARQSVHAPDSMAPVRVSPRLTAEAVGKMAHVGAGAAIVSALSLPTVLSPDLSPLSLVAIGAATAGGALVMRPMLNQLTPALSSRALHSWTGSVQVAIDVFSEHPDLFVDFLRTDMRAQLSEQADTARATAANIKGQLQRNLEGAEQALQGLPGIVRNSVDNAVGTVVMSAFMGSVSRYGRYEAHAQELVRYSESLDPVIERFDGLITLEADVSEVVYHEVHRMWMKQDRLLRMERPLRG